MTNPLDTTPMPDDNVTPSSHPSPDRTKPARQRTAGHIVAIIVGCMLLVPGLGVLTGGGALAVGQAVATDDDGFFRFTLDRVESDGVAVATTELWLDDVEGDASPWVFDFLEVDLRLRVQGAASTDDVFVGIARSADVERYLDRAAYSEVIEVNEHTPAYEQVVGIRSIEPPVDQDFWTVSATGSGEQQLDWQARGGRWSVVVMNADGSPVVAADVEVGARSGAVTPVAIGLIVMGGIVVAIAGVVILIGARGRRSPGVNPSGPAALDNPLPPQPPTSPVLQDEDEHRPTPVG